MLFNSFEFALFLPTVFILYWATSSKIKLRNLVLLVSSYIFYGFWDWRFLILIIISSTVDFFIGNLIHKSKNHEKRKLFLLISVMVNVGFLLYFKYTNFFIESFVDTFRLFGQQLEINTLNIILPVGISFYTFQTLSYTIDIYRNNFKPTNNFLAFYTFVAFFPQLVAGPIERAKHLLPQFSKEHKFNYNLVRNGFLLILFGLFKKMVIADRLALYVNEVYNNSHDYYSLQHIIATIFFAFQIYCDFSGYSDIAIGTARILGFDLMKNFDSPYFSKSITEFWRRWHISLSTWFRDYVYIPLGGSKNGKYRTYLNLFLVFLVSGMWHGAAINFLIWGGIHGVIIVFEKAIYKSKYKAYIVKKTGLDKYNFGNKIFFSIITFCIVSFTWVFFRSSQFSSAMYIIKSFFKTDLSSLFLAETYNIGLLNNEFLLSVIFIILLLLFEYYHKRKSIYTVYINQGKIVRWTTLLIIICTITFFGVYGDRSTNEFIYFQF